MNEEKEIKMIRMLRNLKNIPPASGEKKFLKNLRQSVSAYMAAHPFKNEEKQDFQDIKNKFFIYLKFAAGRMKPAPHGMLTAVIAVFVLGTGTMAVASQTSLPGDPLYPIKLLTEKTQSSLAVTSKMKVKMQSDFAAKRVAEVKAIVEQKDANPEKIEIAMTNFQKTAAESIAIIEKESKKGTDATKMAKNINDELDKNAEVLKQILETQKTILKEKEKTIENNILEAEKSNDRILSESLSNQLGKTKTKRKSFEENWDKNEESFRKNKDMIEKQMDEKEKQLNKKREAEKMMESAKKEKQELIDENANNNGYLTSGAFSEFDAVLNETENLFKQEKYDDAKKSGLEALKIIKIIKNNTEKKSEENRESNGSDEKQKGDKDEK